MALTVFPLQIAAGDSLSGSLMCAAGRLVRIGVPANWTAAPLTFQVSPDGQDFLDLFHVAQASSGDWQTYESCIQTVIPNTVLLMPPDAGFSIGFIKFRSGTRDSPVGQKAGCTFTVVFESTPH